MAFAANDGTGDPDSLKIKLYRFAVSESEDCSNPKIVIDRGSNPTYVSMLSKPSFGSGELDNGTYPCVMIEMSDNIKFDPDGNIGSHCDGNTEYTLDVCNANGGATPYTLLDGTTGTCTGGDGLGSSGAVETKIVLYLSTRSTSTGGGANPFTPPATAGDAGTKGFKLASALVVSGTETGIFDVNGTGKVVSNTGSGGYCEFQPPVFSFSKR